jgi:hypothetical protein
LFAQIKTSATMTASRIANAIFQALYGRRPAIVPVYPLAMT